MSNIVEFNEFESKLQEFKSHYIDVVYDLTDPDQEKQARSDRLTIGKVISALDKKHKDLKAPLKEKVDLIDGERKRIKDDLLDVQERIKSQIKDHEDKIQAHMDMLQGKVDEIYACALFDDFSEPDSVSLKARLSKATRFNVDDSYEHRKADATLAQVETISKLEAMLTGREKYEAEQAELEKLRKEAEARAQKEREEQIAKEAAERATREAEERAKAEKAETERKAQAERDEAEKRIREAEEAAKHAAEQERQKIEAERKAQEAQAEKERQADEAKKAKQAHRQKIHAEAKKSFMEQGFSEDESLRIVAAIKDGLIKNVSITY